MASPEGTILNKSSELKRTTGLIKAGNTVIPGLCYIDGANGVKNAPVDGSILSNALFWYDGVSVTVAAGAVSKKVTVYAIDGLQVVGQAEGVIPVDGPVKPATTASHGGWMITHPVPTHATADEGDTSTTDLGAEIATAINTIAQAVHTYGGALCGYYRGHEDEVLEGKTRTASADEDTNCVFELRGGGF